MRRIAAISAGTAALFASVLAAVPAQAAGGGSLPVKPAPAAGAYTTRAAVATPPKPETGVKHYFHANVTGASVWGDWYWTTVGGSHIVIQLHVTDTKADGKSAGICYDYGSKDGSKDSGCFVVGGKGKTKYVWWEQYNKDTLRVFGAVGKSVKEGTGWTFYYTHRSAWVTVR